MTKRTGVVGLVLVAVALGGCAGRWDPDWSFGNPSCAPDGSVVFYEYPKADGSYDGLKNSPANCSWNRKT
jgi:hypothetical protein